MILLALGVGGACLWPMGLNGAIVDAGPWLLSPEGLGLVGLALPAAMLGLLLSATGHPATGLFVLAVAWSVPATLGGPIDPWLRRVEGASAYGGLSVEACLFAGLLAGYVLLLRAARPRLRDRLPRVLTSNHLGPDDPWGVAPVPLLIALATASLVGGGLAWALIQSSYTGQVTGGLVIAFTVAGLVAQSTSPRASLLGVALAPLVVCIAGAAWAATRFGDATDLLAAWFDGQVWGIALARPLDYASSGVAGSVLGFTLGQAFAQAKQAQADTTAA